MSTLSENERHILEQLYLPYFSLKKSFPLLSGAGKDETEALLLGISAEELRTYRAKYEQNAKQAALELLKEEEVLNRINKLPLNGTETFVALGDSITADAQGWFEILRNVLAISTGNEKFTFINAGVANNTTSEALRRIDRDVLSHKPDWVFVALGTFDAQRLHVLPDRTLIPLSETWENINSISEILNTTAPNPVIWITPAPVLGALLEDNRLYEFTIEEKDLRQIQQLIAAKSGAVIDPSGNRMGEDEPKAWNYSSDGLHHSLAGHLNTVRLILKKMAEKGNL